MRNRQPKSKQSSSNPSKKLLLPKVDIVFKMLYGDARNADILVDFLKSILDLPEIEYEGIVITDPQLKKETPKDKLGIVDIKLITESGKIIHIEMQALPQKYISERITYYNSKMLVVQMKEGDDYYSLQKAISILIADFCLIKGSEKYHHVFQLRDKDSGFLLTDAVEIHTFELGKLPNAPVDAGESKLLSWLQFLKAEKEEEFEMLAERDPIIKKAYAKVKLLSEDERNQMLYEERLKEIRDEKARHDYALEQGLEKGLEQGLAKGLEQGRREIVNKMLSHGLPPEQVAVITGLAIQEIEKLAQSHSYANSDV